MLLKDGQPVALNPKAFDLLARLVSRGGDVLSKDEILQSVWANHFVEENNLTVHISALREALGERKGENSFIATVPGKGYKFVADVKNSDDEEREITIESHTISRVLIENFEIKDETNSENAGFENKSFENSGLTSNRAVFAPVIIFPIIAAVLIIGVFRF